MQKIDFYDLKQRLQATITPIQLYTYAQTYFVLKAFKLNRIDYQKTQLSFQKFKTKYQNQEIELWENEWHKNERKLFIEILIWYCKLSDQFPNELHDHQWHSLSELFFHKNPLLLKYQGLTLLKVHHIPLWDKKDDQALGAIIQKFGEGNWNLVSKQIFFQSRSKSFITPKQCRQRWFNHLSMNIVRTEWTPREDLIILNHVLKKNKRWCQIVKELNSSRTENMVKNRYSGLIKPEKRPDRQEEIKSVESLIRKLQRKHPKTFTEINPDLNPVRTQNQQNQKNQVSIQQVYRNHLTENRSVGMERSSYLINQVQRNQSNMQNPIQPHFISERSNPSNLASQAVYQPLPTMATAHLGNNPPVYSHYFGNTNALSQRHEYWYPNYYMNWFDIEPPNFNYNNGNNIFWVFFVKSQDLASSMYLDANG